MTTEYTPAAKWKDPIDLALLAEVLDSIEDKFCVVDGRGRIRHENNAFRTKIDRQAEPERVRDEIRRLARSALFGATTESASNGKQDLGRVVEFRAGHKNYRARASLMRKSTSDPNPLVLVTLEAVSPASVSDELRDVHRLTPREMQVVELLAEGHSNKRVAEALGVSAHTARHHTGRVLSKLQARGRSEAAAMVRRLYR